MNRRNFLITGASLPLVPAVILAEDTKDTKDTKVVKVELKDLKRGELFALNDEDLTMRKLDLTSDQVNEKLSDFVQKYPKNHILCLVEDGSNKFLPADTKVIVL